MNNCDLRVSSLEKGWRGGRKPLPPENGGSTPATHDLHDLQCSRNFGSTPPPIAYFSAGVSRPPLPPYGGGGDGVLRIERPELEEAMLTLTHTVAADRKKLKQVGQWGRRGDGGKGGRGEDREGVLSLEGKPSGSPSVRSTRTASWPIWRPQRGTSWTTRAW